MPRPNSRLYSTYTSYPLDMAVKTCEAVPFGVRNGQVRSRKISTITVPEPWLHVVHDYPIMAYSRKIVLICNTKVMKRQELGGTLAQDDDEQCRARIVVHPGPG